MIVNDGGGGGPLGDPLAGLIMPTGAPDSLGGIISQMSGWAGQLGTGAQGHRKAVASVVDSSWIGPAAKRCGASVETIAGAAATLGDALDHSGQILSSCQSAWSDAVTLWGKAQHLASEAMADEKSHRQGAATLLAGMTQAEQTADPVTVDQLQARADGYDGYESPYRAQALRAGQTAVDDASQAITTAGNRLAEITAVVNVVGAHPDATKDEFWDEFMDLDVAGPATALTVPGVVGQVMSWKSYANFLKAFDTGDFKYLSKVDPEGWSKVTAVADKYGEDSAEALKAQLKYLNGVGSDASAEAAAGAAPIDGLPGGALGDTLDVLGKVALPLAAAGDVYTLANGKASVVDRSLSGLNLAGLGMAAAGTETGGAVLALVGVNAVADWIPVVGEVVVAGTAIYLGTEWAINHWSEICDWTDDAGKFISSTVTDGEHLVSAGYNDAKTLVTSGLNDLNSAASTGVKDLKSAATVGVNDVKSVATTGVNDVKSVMSSTVNTAKHAAKTVTHDLDPLNW